MHTRNGFFSWVTHLVRPTPTPAPIPAAPRLMSFEDILNKINYHDVIPEEFCCKISFAIMTTPMIICSFENNIETDQIIDESILIKFWEDKETKLDPFTNETIRHQPKLNTNLQKRILAFVAEKVNEACQDPENKIPLDVQLAVVEHTIAIYPSTVSCHQRLLDSTFSIAEMTIEDRNRYVALNLLEEIMTHPVVLDHEHIVDYEILKQWWKSHPDKKYQNFYTGERIKTIRYDLRLRREIEIYVTDPRRLFTDNGRFYKTSLYLFNTHRFNTEVLADAAQTPIAPTRAAPSSS